MDNHIYSPIVVIISFGIVLLCGLIGIYSIGRADYEQNRYWAHPEDKRVGSLTAKQEFFGFIKFVIILISIPFAIIIWTVQWILTLMQLQRMVCKITSKFNYWTKKKEVKC